MSGVSASQYQIPNNPGQMPGFTAFGVSDFDSSLLNENQKEFNQFNVLAVQHSAQGFDIQAAYFNRKSTVHFFPDIVGDMVFNGVASDVYRRSFVNGIQTDASYRWADAHTLRAGFIVSTERTLVNNASLLLPLDDMGDPLDAPFGVIDSSKKTGWLFGTYLQDEWKITNQLTLNAGLRFDQMWQYVDANQLSPRISLTYTPFDGTVLHVGYARYFTPPPQVLAAPTNLALGAEHDPAAGGQSGRPGEAGALARVRRRADAAPDARPRCRRRRLLQERARSCWMTASSAPPTC